MTVAEYIAIIKQLVKQTSDDALQDRFIYDLLMSSRARILSQELDKGNKLSDFNYSTICLPLTARKFSDCACISDAGCRALRSVDKLPRILSSKYTNLLKVYNIDETTEYSRSSMLLSRKVLSRSKTRKDKPVHLIKNQYLWILNTDLRAKATIIRAIFEDIADLEAIDACDSDGQTQGPCFDSAKDDFPIDAKYNDFLFAMVVEKLAASANFITDTENDAKSLLIQ